jgi:hypothetical protein
MASVGTQSLRCLAWAASVALSCRSERTPASVPPQAATDPVASAAATVAPPASASAATELPGPPSPAPAASSPFAEWHRARLPPGGQVVLGEGGSVSVVHTVAAREDAMSIAKAYLDLTTVYRVKDLAAEIARVAPALAAGTRITIPALLSAPYGTPDSERLRWPSDVALKGVFISGAFAGVYWPETIDRLAARKLNAVVLDAKDYMGTVNYPTHVQLAIDTEAASDPPIPDFFRAIRFAHAKGIHVIARIPCFHDPWAAKHAPRLSLMNRDGRPFSMGWIDPANPEAQDYVVDLVKEAVSLGADEVQLDYVRFPVQSKGIKFAAMPPADGHRSQAIRAFVARVHEATRAQQVPLSLDLFGVAATGDVSDIEALGQNIGVIGAQAEALSPMVYPSHYASGWHGFAQPGDHPEIIGIGTRAALQKLKDAKISATIMRPWLQASAYKTPTYGPRYILDEIKSAEAGGAVGWLLWDPENSYWALWQALPPISVPAASPRRP